MSSVQLRFSLEILFYIIYVLRIWKSYIQRFFFVKLNIVQLRFSLEIGRDKQIFHGHGYYGETCF